MPNKIKDSGADGVALQVTHDARSAGLVEENAEGEPTYLAPVRVYTFNDTLLVVNREEMDTRAVAELVAATARDTKSIYQGIDAKMHRAGHGYKVQLPAAGDAGFDVGDVAIAHPGPDLLVITKQTPNGTRLAEDVVAIRAEQVG